MSSGKFTGQNVSGAKLTAEQVIWGREQYDSHIRTRGRQGRNMRQIAEVQGVSRETVARYIRGETWKSIAIDGDALADDRDAALERQAIAMAPAIDSAVIQASLAKLAQLGVVPERLPGVRDPLCTCVGEHDSRTALDCPATLTLTEDNDGND